MQKQKCLYIIVKTCGRRSEVNFRKKNILKVLQFDQKILHGKSTKR